MFCAKQTKLGILTHQFNDWQFNKTTYIIIAVNIKILKGLYIFKLGFPISKCSNIFKFTDIKINSVDSHYI